jgi:phytoene dehydrogenase-like protein
MTNQENTYDVIVVGAGAAGLTAAAYLCKNGYRVLLCEKGNKTGGLVSSFQYKGFIFDAGIRAFENSGIIFPMLKQLGITIDFVKNPVSIGIENNIIELHSKESLFDYEGLLNHYFPDNCDDIRKIIQEIEMVMDYMDVLYGIDNPLFLDFSKDREYLFKTLFPWLIKYQINIKKVTKLNLPVNEYLLGVTHNQALIDMITQHFFKNTPTFFALSYFGLYLDYSYPIGGTEVLPRKLSDYIQTHNGCIYTNTRISSVHAAEKQVVSADGRSFSYKKLIWACDAKYLYDIVKTNNVKSSRMIAAKKQLINSNKGGDSILTVFLGIDLDKDYFQKRCGDHSFYTPSSVGLSAAVPGWPKYKCEKPELFRQITNYLAHTTFEISCPVLRDPNLAPEGNSGLIVSTLMDYTLVKEIHEAGWYEEFKDLCIKTVILILDDSIFSGIKYKVLFSLCSTPLTIESKTGNAQGAITGWAFSDRKLPSETRLKKIAQSVVMPIPDMYQAGQWTFSPSGLPVSILTGKLAADAVNKKLCKDLKNQKAKGNVYVD